MAGSLICCARGRREPRRSPAPNSWKFFLIFTIFLLMSEFLWANIINRRIIGITDKTLEAIDALNHSCDSISQALSEILSHLSSCDPLVVLFGENDAQDIRNELETMSKVKSIAMELDERKSSMWKALNIEELVKALDYKFPSMSFQAPSESVWSEIKSKVNTYLKLGEKIEDDHFKLIALIAILLVIFLLLTIRRTISEKDPPSALLKYNFFIFLGILAVFQVFHISVACFSGSTLDSIIRPHQAHQTPILINIEGEAPGLTLNDAYTISDKCSKGTPLYQAIIATLNGPITINFQDVAIKIHRKVLAVGSKDGHYDIVLSQDYSLREIYSNIIHGAVNWPRFKEKVHERSVKVLNILSSAKGMIEIFIKNQDILQKYLKALDGPKNELREILQAVDFISILHLIDRVSDQVIKYLDAPSQLASIIETNLIPQSLLWRLENACDCSDAGMRIKEIIKTMDNTADGYSSLSLSVTLIIIVLFLLGLSI